MKITSIIGLVVLTCVSQASCHKLRVKMQAYDEETCHQNSELRRVEKIKVNECQNFAPFRSYQISPYHGQLHPGCHIEVFDTKDCKGRTANTTDIIDAPNVCTNATFPVDIGLHSGRSAMLVCDKPDKPSSSSMTPKSTMIEVPYLPTTLTQFKTVTSTMSPGPAQVSIVRVIEDEEHDVLTVTSTRPGVTAVVHVAPSAQTKSYSTTSTVFVQLAEPTESISTVVHVVANNTKPSTTKTFTFTTAFKGKPAPTRRSAVEVADHDSC